MPRVSAPSPMTIPSSPPSTPSRATAPPRLSRAPVPPPVSWSVTTRAVSLRRSAASTSRIPPAMGMSPPPTVCSCITAAITMLPSVTWCASLARSRIPGSDPDQRHGHRYHLLRQYHHAHRYLPALRQQLDTGAVRRHAGARSPDPVCHRDLPARALQPGHPQRQR